MHTHRVSTAPTQPAGTEVYLDFFSDLRPWRHWTLRVDGSIATLLMYVQPDGGIFDGAELKLNSYDMGVELEFADAVRRIRFEHPEVGCVVIGSGYEGVFCAGANIRALAAATHAHKVNLCKFTNETRLELEEASAGSGLRFLAAVGGACSGGGYELALATDHILLVDDRNTAVSLPEVPLLGVLPGTGGLTRLTDKRHVRRDRADVFATRAEGLRGGVALEWGLVDELAPRTSFDEAVNARAAALTEHSRAAGAFVSDEPAMLEPLDISPTPDGSVIGEFVAMAPDRDRACAEVLISASAHPRWPLRAARELDALLCHLRFNEPELGTVVLLTDGSHASVTAHDRALREPANHAERETALLWRRTLSRLDLTARTLIAAVEPGSCFAGVLAEVALAADRTYLLDGEFVDERPDDAVGMAVRALRGPQSADAVLPTLAMTEISLGSMPMANGLTRLQSRLWGDDAAIAAARDTVGSALDAQAAAEAGLATATPDDLDWDDDLRLAVEERAAFSPDALTAMEANHRFCGPETMATKIFGRLSAWQNWIFIRPNATGPDGALTRYGTGTRPSYATDRV
ncbi:MAG: benzoyl-CoA-dihydrodiol lyase [Acidimicrobiales bacterium]|nr:benzoyl-CoA-dihydrodiol lyase [Acidimicrobiales bacterium]MYA26462.1 benzoyl-CoA-dihydrodiol lyase [Acidimicrobiales bacterium]MYA82036.1 benzoyl-CoA-dihydrodiol lyase [Acidimicrobiales bacterium]MYD35358.1 benzoyl-CoA-dihydrodiol lyase [Acidimicrobiales bacterium]MYD84590.1 benzoyl-CoA-dihydrodiol lyase [Acidimicrobiales bacterium]